MSGLGDNLGKYLHPARNRPTETTATQDDAPDPGMGDKMRGRIERGMFRLKPKSPEEQTASDKALEADNAKNATRASLIGSRG